MRPDAPPAIKKCATLYDKLFSGPFELHPDQEHEAEIPWKASSRLPPDLRRLLNGMDVQLHGRLKHHGVFYTTSTVHLGNSLVYYYQSGDRKASPTPGQIQHIFTREQQCYFAILRHLPVPKGTPDPFRFYVYMPIKLYSSTFAEGLEIVEVDWVMGHCARWLIAPSQVAVVSLSRVGASLTSVMTCSSHMIRINYFSIFKSATPEFFRVVWHSKVFFFHFFFFHMPCPLL
jgi:hypothetical protein